VFVQTAGAGVFRRQTKPAPHQTLHTYTYTHTSPKPNKTTTQGLIKLEWATGRVEILANTIAADSPIAPGAPITYANDLDIAPDGTVYFTSCSDIVPQRGAGGFWDTYKAWLLDFMRGAPRGRLLAYDPNTKRARALAEGFYYANGVAVASDGSYLLMVETNRLRVHRHWLQGPRAGETEVVIDRLPGAPDGVSRAADGNFWVAVLAPVPPVAKLLGEVGVRAAYAWLPDRLRPPLKSWGAVVKVGCFFSGGGALLLVLVACH
jgi:hypothetical protein